MAFLFLIAGPVFVSGPHKRSGMRECGT